MLKKEVKSWVGVPRLDDFSLQDFTLFFECFLLWGGGRVTYLNIPAQDSYAHTEHRTQNTEPRTQNPEHRTQNTEHRTQNTEHRTQNTEHRTVDAILYVHTTIPYLHKDVHT
jgi:hypothetical protein